MEQSSFRNPRLIRRFTILSFSRPMGNEAGIPSPRGGKKMGGKKEERKKEEICARHRGDMEERKREEGGRERIGHTYVAHRHKG